MMFQKHVSQLKISLVIVSENCFLNKFVLLMRWVLFSFRTFLGSSGLEEY